MKKVFLVNDCFLLSDSIACCSHQQHNVTATEGHVNAKEPFHFDVLCNQCEEHNVAS